MDKVLKSVGLSKRGTEIKNSQQTVSPERDQTTVISKRRRCENQRFLNHEKGLRGLFNIDWESVKDCKSKAMTRKLCGKRCNNELYRSNSFKFERFVRTGEETATLGHTISLCDDYSLPIDNVKKKRPKSIATNPSKSQKYPADEQSQIRDSQPDVRINDQVIDIEKEFYTKSNRKFFQPYITEYFSDSSSNGEFKITCDKSSKFNSPDSVIDVVLSTQGATNLSVQSPKHADVKRYPSPYYYADLYKSKQEDPNVNNKPKIIKDFKDLNIPTEKLKESEKPKEKSKKHSKKDKESKKDKNQKKYKRALSLESKTENIIIDSIPIDSYKKCCGIQTQSIDLSGVKIIDYNTDVEPTTEQPKASMNKSSPCIATLFPSQNEINVDEIIRKKHHYETAFDSSIAQTENEIDHIDKVSNHPVLLQISSNKLNQTTGTSHDYNLQTCKITLCPDETIQNISVDEISQNLKDTHLTTKEESPKVSGTLLLRVYTPSPPSTSPLSTKFYNNKTNIKGTENVSNIPYNARGQYRSKDLRLPVKSSHNRNIHPSKRREESGDIRVKNEREPSAENKPRNRKVFKRYKDGTKDIMCYSKGFRRRCHKYSSTESISSSSSAGSMESLQSSTSEENRSSSSSNSRPSSSLSSHSSDSENATNNLKPQSYNVLTQTEKLNTLSPISDKSSHEPVTEISDNHNNNSQEEICNSNKSKKRLPINKNIFSLGLHSRNSELQGSDSGISIQSREGKTVFGLMTMQEQNLSDLPFDMPKLKVKCLTHKEGSKSGSTNSVNVKDLPFDMPKLKRRLRNTTDGVISQASSSQSTGDIDKQVTPYQPIISLNLKDDIRMRPRPDLNLSFGRLGLNLDIRNNTSYGDIIDATLPLERQGWYHGAITRVEAEFVLKFLEEGSFLVRNSESTRQDYSLSLKSARGFVHMRIQHNGVDSFILGQFGKPFRSIPEMIHHFSLNRLPVRGAEHMCLLQPVIAQLL